MNSWTPLFSKIVDSSLWEESDLVVKVFLSMLAKRDADNVVRGTAYQIGKWSVKTEKEALAALKVLASPDTKRLEKQPYDGRRVEKVEDGWLILNGAHYQKLMADVSKKAGAARRQARRRDKLKEGKSIPSPSQTAYMNNYGEHGQEKADEDFDKEQRANEPPPSP